MKFEMVDSNLDLEGLGPLTQDFSDPRKHGHIFLSKESQHYLLVHIEV